MMPPRPSAQNPAPARTVRFHVAALAAAAALAVTAAGCKKNDPRGEGAPLTGKSSDPPVSLVARWDDTNAYVYHLESITGTQVPRRNSTVVIQQDTTLAKDFRFAVTNYTKDGVRTMSMEIQAVRVDTTADQRLTSAFDTENEMLSTEDNTIASRLQRVKGARLGFKLNPLPSSRILRVDGVKEFGDRVGGNRNVRGAAGAVLNKFFNVQFYRDVVEMTYLPTNAVRVGDTWTSPPRTGPGLYDSGGAEVTYTFRGWQVREGTNCARLDFVVASKSSSPSTNQPRDRVELNGSIWFSPGLGVPVEIQYDQSVTRHTTTTRSVRPSGTNASGGTEHIVRTASVSPPPRDGKAPKPVAPPPAEIEEESEAPHPAPGVVTSGPTGPAEPSGKPNGPGSPPAGPPPGEVVTTSRTTTIKQHVVITLVELVPVDPPASSPNAVRPEAGTTATP